jgi:alpha-N-arabinofuranosidase
VGTICKHVLCAKRLLRVVTNPNREGATPADRWQWNTTIGPVQDRPGRQGDWGYANTDALGMSPFLDRD